MITKFICISIGALIGIFITSLCAASRCGDCSTNKPKEEDHHGGTE